MIRQYWPFEKQLEVEMVLRNTGLYKFHKHWPNSQSTLTSAAPSSTARLISLQRKLSFLCTSHFESFYKARRCHLFFLACYKTCENVPHVNFLLKHIWISCWFCSEYYLKFFWFLYLKSDWNWNIPDRFQKVLNKKSAKISAIFQYFFSE